MIEGKKGGWRRGIKADLQGLFQHQSATSFFLSHYSSDTNMHTYTQSLSRRVTNTHFDVFFPRCINKKKNLWMLVPCFWWRGLFPTSLPNTMRTCERTEWLCLEGHLQENAARYREMIPSVGFFPPDAHHYSNAQAEGEYTIRVQHSRNIHLNDCASWSVTKFVDFIRKLTFNGNVFLIHCTAEAYLWPIKRF